MLADQAPAEGVPGAVVELNPLGGLEEVVLSLFADSAVAASAPPPPPPPRPVVAPPPTGAPRAAAVSFNPLRQLQLLQAQAQQRPSGGPSTLRTGTSRVARAHTHHGASLSHLLDADPVPPAPTPRRPPSSTVVQVNPLSAATSPQAPQAVVHRNPLAAAASSPPAAVHPNPMSAAAQAPPGALLNPLAAAGLQAAPHQPGGSSGDSAASSLRGGAGEARMNPLAAAISAAAALGAGPPAGDGRAADSGPPLGGSGSPSSEPLDLGERPQRVRRMSMRMSMRPMLAGGVAPATGHPSAGDGKE